MDEVTPALCAGACCFAMYGLAAGGAGWLVQLRTRKVEAELGRPALPDPEIALLLYAGASVVWLSAAVLAAVGLLGSAHASASSRTIRCRSTRRPRGR